MLDPGPGSFDLQGVGVVGWRQIIGGLLDSILVLDRDGIIRFANRANHAASVDELLGRPLSELMLPEDREPTIAIHRAVLESGEPATYQRSYKPAPGVDRIYEVRVSRLVQSDVVLGLIVSGRDITERVRVQEREQHLERVLALVPEAVLILDPRSKALLASNAATVALYGYSSEALLGLTLRDLEARPGVARGGRAPTSAGLGATRGICWHRHRDGTVFPVGVTTSRLSQGDQEVELRVVRDMSPLHDLQESLEQGRDLLMAKNELLEQKNAALRELIDQVRTERVRVREQVQANVCNLVLPHLDRLRARLQPAELLDLELLESNLHELTSSFGSRISDLGAWLSPREVEVCNHIRQGRTSQQIAAALGLSAQSVAVHRRNIRRKLRLTHRGVNLQTFLQRENG